MWIYSTTAGHLSATRADFRSPVYADMPRPDGWDTEPWTMVRSRVRDDLVQLVERYGELVPSRTDIIELSHHDYPHRLLVPQREWVAVIGRLAEDVQYSNFKQAVAEQARTPEEGQARAALYHRVWSVMYGAEEWLQRRVNELQQR